MHVLDHLTEEHRRAEQLLGSLAASEPGTERTQTLDELEQALGLHLAVEERFLYPVVRREIGTDEATEAQVEHDLTRAGLDQLRQLVDTPGFGAAVAMLRAGVEHHVEEEENELFPQLRSTAGDLLQELDPEVLEELAGATRAELYRRAQEAGVPGRSSMGSDELAEALSRPDAD